MPTYSGGFRRTRRSAVSVTPAAYARSMPDTLTDVDKKLLTIFGQAWVYPGEKEQAVRESTGLSMVQATQRVNALIDTEAALAWKPQVVNRLRRIREVRQLSRPTSNRV